MTEGPHQRRSTVGGAGLQLQVWSILRLRVSWKSRGLQPARPCLGDTSRLAGSPAIVNRSNVFPGPLQGLGLRRWNNPEITPSLRSPDRYHYNQLSCRRNLLPSKPRRIEGRPTRGPGAAERRWAGRRPGGSGRRWIRSTLPTPRLRHRSWRRSAGPSPAARTPNP